MFFYTSLFIASIFAAFIILWVFHAFAHAGQALLSSMLPSNKKGPTSHLSVQTMPKTVNYTQTPWGWKNHDTPANMAKTHAAKPGNSQVVDHMTTTPDKPMNAGWVQREERSELGGKAYKVTRKTESLAEGFKSADRPWGW